MTRKKSDTQPISPRKRPDAKPQRGQAATARSRQSKPRSKRGSGELEQRQAELAVINSIQQGLAAQLDMQAIYDLVGDKIREIFDAQAVIIATLDQDKQTMDLRYMIERGQRYYPQPDSYGNIAKQMIVTRQPVAIMNPAQWEVYGVATVPGTEEAKSAVYVPLVVGDQVKGVISLQNVDRENAFSESDVRLLTTLANSTSVALENARLFDETQRLFKAEQQRAAELAIINSIQQGLAAQLDVQAIYDLFGDKIRDIFDAQAIVIYMFDHARRLSRACYGVENGRRFYPAPRPFSKMAEHLIRTRELVLINEDAERRKADLGLQIVPGTESARSLVYVPLAVGEHVIGCVTLQNVEHENAFSESDVRLLTTLANNMSVALENGRLFAETQQHAREQEIIASVAQMLASQLDRQRIYELVGDKLRDLFNAQVVTLSTLDPAENVIHYPYVIEKGERQNVASQPPFGFTAHVIKTREPLLLNSVTDETRAAYGSHILAGSPTKSWLGVPIIISGAVRGVISLQNVDCEDAFADSDLRVLATVALNVGVALENARLFNETKRLLAEMQQRAREQEIIASVAQMLALQLDMQRIYESVGNKLRDLFNAQVVALGILDPVENVLHHPYMIEKGERQNAASQPPSGFTAHVIKTREPLLLNSVTDDTRIQYGSRTLAGSPTKSWLGVPIITGGAVKGVISLQNVDREDAFAESDLRVLATVALNVGVALENARLFEQAQEAHRRLADIVDFLPDATLVMDRAGRVIAWNRAIEEMTGVKAQDMIGKGNYEYAIPFYGERRPILIDLVLLPQEEVERRYANISREGAALIGETYVSSLKGGGRYLLGTASALRDAKGNIVGAIESIRDLTDRKHATEELEQAKLAADSANLAKSAFLATMSHEIRTPMNAIIGMSGLLMDTPLNPEQREYAEIIRNSGDALLTLVNDILDFSKIEAGKMELENQPFELRACVESALDLVAPRAAEKGLDLACVIDDDVPAAVVGDVTRLRQIMLNLLTNAVKFTEKGEVVLTVESAPAPVFPERPATRGPPLHELHFSVRDTGIGIPADGMDRLFLSFSQIDPTTTRRYGGTGLGLAISKRLCEMMGGRVWAESPSVSLPPTGRTAGGAGSTFHFTIRAQPAPDFEVPKRATGAQPELSGKRLLIVDDNDTNRLIVIRQARAWGMLTRDTASPKEALDWITRGDPFDIAIVDMSMPEMDGLTLCAEIRKHRANLAKGLKPLPGLPLVICSSLGRREAITDELGIAAILQKPLKQSQLFDALAGIFAGPSPEQKPAAPAAPRLDAEMARHLPLRILLAEDNATNQKLALRLLQQMGYRADVAGNGLEAIEALARQVYDVVLMDVQMPEMDGLEAARQICLRWTRAERPRIIAMTANALQGDREICLAAGMDDYIAKPIRVHELVEALRKCSVRRQKEEPMTETLAIDVQVLDGLVASIGGDLAFLGELMDTYFGDAPQLLAAMRGALAGGNVEEFRRAAHSLKSNSANLGAVTLSALAKELEMMGKAGTLDGAAEKIPAVEAEYARVKAALEKFRIK